MEYTTLTEKKHMIQENGGGEEAHMIIITDAENAFDFYLIYKIQYLFYDKNNRKLRIEEDVLNIIKTVLLKTHSKCHTQW